MDNTPEEQEVSTEAQRQALDAMSSELMDKLNRMIEEQNARVQEFAMQYPQADAPAPEPVTYQVPQPEPPAERPLPEPPRPMHSVTPPPVGKPRPQTYRAEQSPTAPPPLPRRAPQPEKKQKEEGIGCGTIIFVIIIVLIIIRSCN